MRIIDLSVDLGGNPHGERMEPKIRYVDHNEAAGDMERLWHIPAKDFPGGKWLSREEVQAMTHNSTHLDAPYHFGPLVEGKPAKTIDQVPLEWCYGNGVVLDVRHLGAGDHITVEHVKASLAKIGYTLRPRDIVLLMTGANKHFRTPKYQNAHPGMTREATLWIVEHGIKLIGIDAYGFDRPFDMMADDNSKGNHAALWPAHFAGRDQEYCHLEKLANLDQVPVPFGFTFAAFPIKIPRASAGWVRAVAICE